MKKNKILHILSWILVFLMIFIVITDLRYKFGNYDTPFMLEFVLYVLYVFIKRTASKLSFGIVLLFILSMGVSYMLFGSARLTERMGEWFYLYFLFGLLQYSKEIWLTKKL